METQKKEKQIEHPLESVLGIEQGTTIVEYTEVLPTPITTSPIYDDKDQEIEEKLEEVYAIALSNIASLSDEIERVDGRYKARVGEVTASMLNIALGSVREKRELKQHKDKISIDSLKAGTPNTIHNNLVVADRNEILRIMKEAGK